MSDHSSASDKSIKDFAGTVGKRYGWPAGCWVTLIEFAEDTLQQQQMAELNKTIVAAMTETMEDMFSEAPTRCHTIVYRTKSGTLRRLEKEIATCRDWLHKNQLPLKPQTWIIWNLAPFFRKRAKDPIGWRALVRFLNCVPYSRRLVGIRKIREDEVQDEKRILDLEAKRIAALYETVPTNTKLERKIRRLLKIHVSNRAESPLKALHTQAAEHFRKLTS